MPRRRDDVELGTRDGSGKRTSSSFLHNGTRAMFEQAGFTFERHIGTSKTVMRLTVPPAPVG
ncbi:hypothetical protein [Curtobacterium sp. USHLN213]|uniref:hypothetical protein n=1 Tax=Curtobacterium sp. USHLN213 TaxID=3081255 RepID=UPI0030187CF2